MNHSRSELFWTIQLVCYSDPYCTVKTSIFRNFSLYICWKGAFLTFYTWKAQFVSDLTKWIELPWRMLKAPPLKSLDLHFSVIKCHCQTYDDNIGPKLKKAELCYFGGILHLWGWSFFMFLRYYIVLTILLSTLGIL